MGAGADDHAMCHIRRGRDKRETLVVSIRETRTMWDATDLRYDFNALMNITFFLTNKIKLLSQQIL